MNDGQQTLSPVNIPTTSFPTKARTALITWIVVYPMITALLLLLEPLVASWPMPLRTLLLTGLMVPAMVFWAMPAANRRFHHFLNTH